MALWTLRKIREGVRQATGRFEEGDMSNDEIDENINYYYQYIFPSEVKLDAKFTFYEFMSSKNQATYTAPKEVWTNFEPPAAVNNYTMDWSQDPTRFEEYAPLQYQFSTPWTGDDSTVTFTTTVSSRPIYPASLTISDGTETFEDTNENWTTSDITLVGTLGGTATINYDTGEISVTFVTAPSDGESMYLNYVSFKSSRPEKILYFNDQFKLSPPPDQAYKIKIPGYKVVDELVSSSDTPDLNEWGPCIMYGASKLLATRYGEMDLYADMSALHQEQISNILTRTCENLMNVRVNPDF